MTEPLDLHGAAIDAFDRRVRAVNLPQLANPTPCADWDVHDLINHLVTEQLWTPHLLAGKTIAEAGGRFDGDNLGDEPTATWEVAAREARAAWLQPGALERTVDLSFGRAPALLYLRQMTFDLTVHAWDLARAVGAEERLDPALTAEVYSWAREQEFGPGPLFAKPAPVAEGADTQTRLLALTGRSP